MSGHRGSALCEALVAAGLAGLATAALVVSATSAARAVRRASETSVALTLATDQLERLRSGPRANGQDNPIVAGVTFERVWQVSPGRGAPDHLAVVVRRGLAQRAALDTEVAP